MQKRALGRSGISIAPLVLGGNVFGFTADEATSFAILDAFVDEGFSCIDTADSYSAWVPGHTGGESEIVIGKWLKARGRRDEVVIATKVGMWAPRPGLSAANIKAAAEDSLRRLQTDYIDLYQSHPDDATLPQEEPARAYGDLVAEGKVRAIAASNFDAARLTSARTVAADLGLPLYETLQPHYNLFDRQGFEAELAGVCGDQEIAVIPYYGLASGFLTGKYRSEADFGKSVRGRGMGRYLNDRGLKILAALDEVSAGTGATDAQVALAWLMTKITAPIASATSAQQLKDIAGAARLTLSPEAIAKLDAASA